MADGLALAETTPGPLIMVVQFVAFLGGFRAPEPLSPLAMGVCASLLTTWATFAPCFLWILLGAPYVERLRHSRALAGSLSLISAAVVGVVAHVSVLFAEQALFTRVGTLEFQGLRVAWPDWSTLDSRAVLIAAVSAGLLRKARRGLLEVLGWSAGAGLVLSWLWPGAG
jgi:chromate transporter